MLQSFRNDDPSLMDSILQNAEMTGKQTNVLINKGPEFQVESFHPSMIIDQWKLGEVPTPNVPNTQFSINTEMG
jgi:hypothetical protein